MKPGWWIHLTYVEDMRSEKASRHPWKRFRALLAEPTLTEAELALLVVNGRRDGENEASRPSKPPLLRATRRAAPPMWVVCQLFIFPFSFVFCRLPSWEPTPLYPAISPSLESFHASFAKPRKSLMSNNLVNRGWCSISFSRVKNPASYPPALSSRTTAAADGKVVSRTVPFPSIIQSAPA